MADIPKTIKLNCPKCGKGFRADLMLQATLVVERSCCANWQIKINPAKEISLAKINNAKGLYLSVVEWLPKGE